MHLTPGCHFRPHRPQEPFTFYRCCVPRHPQVERAMKVGWVDGKRQTKQPTKPTAHTRQSKRANSGTFLPLDRLQLQFPLALATCLVWLALHSPFHHLNLGLSAPIHSMLAPPFHLPDPFSSLSYSLHHSLNLQSFQTTSSSLTSFNS